MRRLPLLALPLLLAACAPAAGPQSPLPPAGAEASSQRDVSDLAAKAASGDADAAFRLGAIYHDGDGMTADFAKAKRYFTAAADAGERRAQYNLGIMALRGEGGPASPSQAGIWFARAADAGNVPALYQLGLLAYQGNGTAKDALKARDYFERAALRGYPAAQYNLGILYVRGEGVEQDPVEGWAWLSVARTYDYPKAADAIAKLEPAMTAQQKAAAKARADTLSEQVEKAKAVEAAGGEA